MIQGLSPSIVSEMQALEGDRELAAITILRIWTDHIAVTTGEKVDMVPVDWVEWAKRGDPSTGMEMKISHAKRDPILWRAIGPYYEKWKQGQDITVDGHPVDAWAAVSRRQADHLKSNLVFSIQDVSNLTDDQCSRLGAGMIALRAKARKFLDMEGQTAASALVAEREATITAMKTEMETMRKTIADLSARMPQRDKPGDAAGKR